MGKKFTEEHKKALRVPHIGSGIYDHKRNYVLTPKRLEHLKSIGWKKGHGRLYELKDRSLLAKHQVRNDSAYCNWRLEVYKRDNYKCKINNCDCSGRIIAHHILGFGKYPELRYEINNGITLCQFHHPKRRNEEKRLVPFFMGLMTVSN